MNEQNKLSEEDMARVNQYLNSGYNVTERKPFKPVRLMVMLLIVVTSLSILSIGLARFAGIEG